MSNPLENYLSQFSIHLKGIPAERRDAEIEEMRQHILALIQHRMESGDSKEAATDAALRQFGTPRDNGRNIRKMWSRGGRNEKLNRFIAFVHFLCVSALLFSIITGVTHRPLRPFGHWHGKTIYAIDGLSYLSFLPTHLYRWGDNSSFVLATFLLFGGLAVFSLVFFRQLRTIFLGVFAVLVGSALTIQFMLYAPINYLTTPEQCIFYIWKPVLFFLSISALLSSLWRDKSLVTSPPRREMA